MTNSRDPDADEKRAVCPGSGMVLSGRSLASLGIAVVTPLNFVTYESFYFSYCPSPIISTTAFSDYRRWPFSLRPLSHSFS